MRKKISEEGPILPVSFIHCGDIHLGYNQYNNRERFNDFHRAFSQIVDYAIEMEVDFFLITGDFFNKRSINPLTLSQAIFELGRLKEKEIQVIAIEGNHDKAPYGEVQSWMQFLSQHGYFYLLSSSFDDGCLILKPYQEKQGGNLIAFPGIRFVGLGYQGSMTARRLAELDAQLEKTEEPTVLLLHSAVDMLMHLGGIKYQDIVALKEKIDYVAMGHIHHRYEFEGWIYNPGCPESWDLGEGAKEKGFYHVNIDKGNKKVTYVPSIKRPVYHIAVNVSDCRDLDEVYALCDNKLEKMEEPQGLKPLVQMVIAGSISFSPLAIDTRLLEEKIAATFNALIVEVVNNTVLKGEEWEGADNPAEINREELERDVLRKFFLSRGNLNAWIDDLVDLSKNVKELIHQEAEDQSISVLIENLAEKIVKAEKEDTEDEVVAGAESGEKGREVQ